MRRDEAKVGGVFLEALREVLLGQVLEHLYGHGLAPEEVLRLKHSLARTLVAMCLNEIAHVRDALLEVWPKDLRLQLVHRGHLREPNERR